MCRNHSHVHATAIQGARLPDGTEVYIVDLALPELTVEIPGTGATSTRISCTRLLALAPAPGTGFSTHGPLMEGLAALSYVWGTIDSDSGPEA